MASFPSFTAGWDPLWKGLGLEAAEELPAPESFDTENSLKKRVSFAHPVMSSDQDEEEKKKEKWRWRRKMNKDKALTLRQTGKSREDEPSLGVYSGESFDTFEARALEHRDENMEGDFWDEDDFREKGEEVQGLWSALFNFGDDERDFEDGWTEGDSTNVSEETGTFVSEGETFFSEENELSLDSSLSIEIQKDDPIEPSWSAGNDEEEGEEVELSNRSNRSIKSTESGIPILSSLSKLSSVSKPGSVSKQFEEQRDESSPPGPGPGTVVERDDGDVLAATSWTSAASWTFFPTTFGQTSTDEASKLDTRQSDTFSNAKQVIGDQPAAPEGLSKMDNPTEELKTKKKARWKVGRGRREKDRSSKKSTRRSPPSSKSLESKEKRDHFKVNADMSSSSTKLVSESSQSSKALDSSAKAKQDEFRSKAEMQKSSKKLVSKSPPTSRSLDSAPKEKLNKLSGKTEKDRSTNKLMSRSPPSSPRPLNPTFGGRRPEFIPPPSKIGHDVDIGGSGIAHKLCVPVLFGEKRRKKEPIGKLLWQSQKSSFNSQLGSVSVNSDLTSQATSHARSYVPLVRIVSDIQGNQGPVVGNAKFISGAHQQMQIQESLLATSQGPQSIYRYDYDSGMDMDVCYKKFGDDPTSVLHVREYKLPLTAFPGTTDVIVMVEVRSLPITGIHFAT